MRSVGFIVWEHVVLATAFPDPSVCAAFDSFPSDDHDRESRVTEDGGRFLAVLVFVDEFPFESFRINNPSWGDGGDGAQTAQVCNLVRGEFLFHHRSFPRETTYAIEAVFPWRI